jgi:hypothetical protein
MSDILVDIGPVEQQAPSTSSQPSLAHLGQWIRRGTIRYTQQGGIRIMSPRQPSRHPYRNRSTYLPQYCGPSQSAIAYKKPPPRDRRTTPRPSERPDVHVRRQHPPNPGPIRHCRVPPTHATHYKPDSQTHYEPTHLHTQLQTRLGQYVFKL